ncbi:hypothetical protein ACQKJG_18650 [Priestia megaterium]|uniref:hypothetical protein n=1 Tax=Priestia megaterium TaxID=1404 RepID=UPI003CFDBA8D
MKKEAGIGTALLKGTPKFLKNVTGLNVRKAQKALDNANPAEVSRQQMKGMKKDLSNAKVDRNIARAGTAGVTTVGGAGLGGYKAYQESNQPTTGGNVMEQNQISQQLQQQQQPFQQVASEGIMAHLEKIAQDEHLSAGDYGAALGAGVTGSLGAAAGAMSALPGLTSPGLKNKLGGIGTGLLGAGVGAITGAIPGAMAGHGAGSLVDYGRLVKNEQVQSDEDIKEAIKEELRAEQAKEASELMEHLEKVAGIKDEFNTFTGRSYRKAKKELARVEKEKPLLKISPELHEGDVKIKKIWADYNKAKRNESWRDTAIATGTGAAIGVPVGKTLKEKKEKNQKKEATELLDHLEEKVAGVFKTLADATGAGARKAQKAYEEIATPQAFLEREPQMGAMQHFSEVDQAKSLMDRQIANRDEARSNLVMPGVVAGGLGIGAAGAAAEMKKYEALKQQAMAELAAEQGENNEDVESSRQGAGSVSNNPAGVDKSANELLNHLEKVAEEAHGEKGRQDRHFLTETFLGAGPIGYLAKKHNTMGVKEEDSHAMANAKTGALTAGILGGAAGALQAGPAGAVAGAVSNGVIGGASGALVGGLHDMWDDAHPQAKEANELMDHLEEKVAGIFGTLGSKASSGIKNLTNSMNSLGGASAPKPAAAPAPTPTPNSSAIHLKNPGGSAPKPTPTPAPTPKVPMQQPGAGMMQPKPTMMQQQKIANEQDELMDHLAKVAAPSLGGIGGKIKNGVNTFTGKNYNDAKKSYESFSTPEAFKLQARQHGVSNTRQHLEKMEAGVNKEKEKMEKSRSAVKGAAGGVAAGGAATGAGLGVASLAKSKQPETNQSEEEKTATEQDTNWGSLYKEAADALIEENFPAVKEYTDPLDRITFSH